MKTNHMMDWASFERKESLYMQILVIDSVVPRDSGKDSCRHAVQQGTTIGRDKRKQRVKL